MIKVVPVSIKGNLLKQFIDFPHRLYKDDPYYVPELYTAQKKMLSQKGPFFLHSDMELLLAYKNEEIVGRIAVIHNKNHNTFNEVQDGFFGFFDCVNDQNVANALLGEAEKWLKNRNLNTLIGPVNPSTNETCGLLIDGFDSSPQVMMPYNHPYYIELLENYGLQKQVDLLAYAIYHDKLGQKPVRLHAVLTERLARKGITIRPIDLKRRFKEDINKFADVYNEAWDKNMGFVPFTREEILHLGSELKMIADPDFCMIAEKDGKAIGVSLAIPNINQITKNIKNGRLFPTGVFKLLLGLKKIESMRVVALGVTAPYRKLGIEACFFASLIKNGLKKNMKMAEASWILEHNDLINRAISNVGGELYKKYRLYEKAI